MKSQVILEAKMKYINADNLLDYAFCKRGCAGVSSARNLHLLSQVIDAAYERLGADESLPLIVSGESMGGDLPR